jgi:hypothetical protein
MNPALEGMSESVSAGFMVQRRVRSTSNRFRPAGGSEGGQVG